MASSFAFEKFFNGLRGMVFEICFVSNRCLTFESFAFKDDFDIRGKLLWAKFKNSSTVRDGITYCLMQRYEKMYSSALLHFFWDITTSFGNERNVKKNIHCQVNFWIRISRDNFFHTSFCVRDSDPLGRCCGAVLWGWAGTEWTGQPIKYSPTHEVGNALKKKNSTFAKWSSSKTTNA